MKRNFIALLLCLCLTPLFSQNRAIDSLKVIVSKTTDTAKVNALNQLSIALLNIGEYESSTKYATEAVQLSEKIDFKKGLAVAFNIIGNNNIDQGNYEKALDFHTKALQLREDLGNKAGVATSLNNIGIIYKSKGDLPKALDYYYKSLRIREAIGDKNGIGASYNNISSIYDSQGELQKALDYQFKALKIREELNDRNGVAASYNNIGTFYDELKDFPKALNYHFKSLAIMEELGDKNGMAMSHGNIGLIYEEQNLNEKALQELFKALEISIETGYKWGEIIALNSIGNIYFKQKQFSKALEYCHKSLNISKEMGSLDLEKNAEQFLSSIYEEMNDGNNALKYYKAYIASRDSIYNEENTRKSMEAEMNFEFEKKEALQKEEVHRQKIVKNAFIGGFLIMLAFAVMVYRNFRQKQKANILLSVQKNEILLKNEELNQQNEEIATQRDLIESQKSLVENKQKEMVDSIHYAQRIQQSRLPSETYINSHIYSKEYFIFYHPKDIVSGDFYWAIHHQDLFYFITADCTGHGVPGAFMSLLSISFLDEIVLERKILKPNEILNEMRKELIRALNPDGGTKYKDGMDCTLMAFDFKNNLLHFAAANNPLWILRNQSLQKYKADKMPVGLSEGPEKSFNLQTIELQKGDQIYAFTDGYADQFGGTSVKKEGKKFKYKQLQELLSQHYSKSMKEQKDILIQAFHSWKGDLDQVDDILIFGIRV